MRIFASLDAFLAFSPSPGGEQPNMLVQFAPFILIFVIFYFLLIAPQRKRQKKHTEMLGALKNGDKVVTQGGVHGTVAGVAESVVQLRVADGVKIEVSKSAIATLRDGDQ
jgi:preprotein translocase subunit YajC